MLTDNEKTVTVEHVAGIAVRNPGAVAFGRHYGLTIATCLPADPQTKGGSEATVRIAKADLVPTAANLLAEYDIFAALEAACAAFCESGQRPAAPGDPAGPGGDAGRGAGPAAPVPAAPFTAAFGVTRKVDGLSMVAFEGGRYSVPAPARRAGCLGPPPR